MLNIYVRVACGLMLSLSSLAMATAEGAVVQAGSDHKAWLTPAFATQQTPSLYAPRKGWSYSTEKKIPVEFWQGRDAHSYFDGC